MSLPSNLTRPRTENPNSKKDAGKRVLVSNTVGFARSHSMRKMEEERDRRFPSLANIISSIVGFFFRTGEVESGQSSSSSMLPPPDNIQNNPTNEIAYDYNSNISLAPNTIQKHPTSEKAIHSSISFTTNIIQNHPANENANDSPTRLTPKQRRRMEFNKKLALAKRQVLQESTSLSHQQKEVLSAVARGCSVFITGSAGTGKSFLLRHIIKALKDAHQPHRVFVTASTGVAACAIDGQTLHSFAGIGLGKEDRESLFSRVSENKQARKRWESAKALVIDEVSMIDGQLFDDLEYIARRVRTGFSNWVWGGIQLIVSGDFFQLPPIKPANPNKEFAFQADCWASSFDLQVELTHIFRQSDSQLIDLLQGIRRGQKDQAHLKLLNCCCTQQAASKRLELNSSIIRLYPRNQDVRRINEERLKSLGEEIISYRAIDSGEDPWKRQLGQGIAPEALEVCLGARVMLIKNKKVSCGLVNGAAGTVTGFVESASIAIDMCCKPLLPKVRFDSGQEMVVAPDTWDVVVGERVLATRMQVPLILAWALTIHKCQGMTLDLLHTDLSKAFGCGMVYVALSRVRSLTGLYLSGFNASKIMAHPKVLEFYQRLLDGQEAYIQ